MNPKFQLMWYGHLLTADFDISVSGMLKLYDNEINSKLREMQPRLDSGEFDKLEVGVFRKNLEVRVWGVTIL